MGQVLRILHLEDSDSDAALIQTLLLRDGLDCEIVRVETREEFEAALEAGGVDLILSDYTLPSFDGLSALAVARMRCPDVPFLLVSGTIGEEKAVEGLKAGANDFVLKDSYIRVAPAVRRALQEARERAARRGAEEALRTSEERYALTARGANDGLWDWDLRSDTVYFSSRWKSMLGWGDAEIGDRPLEWFERVHPEDESRLKANLDAHLEGRAEHFESEYRIAHRDGGYRWMLSRALAVRDEEGRALRLAGSQTDISSRKAAEEQLLHDAFYDALTGLPNRPAFMDRLTLVLRQARRRPHPCFAVLFLDLDGFKVVNDSLGHLIGDRLLVAIARKLEACLRQGDTVARLGGDEFALLLGEVADVADVAHAAVRIHRALGTAFHLEGHEVFTSASIGIALSTSVYEKPEDVLRDADTAMYRAKALGRARHAVFDETMHARAVELLRLETDLRRAVEKGEFRLHYQPVVRLADGRTASFEGLLRWRHPERGLVLPGDFIRVAEETGLIVPMGRWVLREACQQMRSRRGLIPGIPMVTVNLSPRQLVRADLLAEVGQILDAAGMEGAQLGLEITESVLMESGEAVRARLLDLRKLGPRLFLDDFGTGYSSLSYLHRFPIDALKIDASFVRGLEVDPKKAELVRSILAIGHNLHMRVIAEGVENARQAEALRALGCEYGQGFYWSLPVEAEAIKGLWDQLEQ